MSTEVFGLSTSDPQGDVSKVQRTPFRGGAHGRRCCVDHGRRWPARPGAWGALDLWCHHCGTVLDRCAVPVEDFLRG